MRKALALACWSGLFSWKEVTVDTATLAKSMGNVPGVDYAAYTEPFSYAPEELRGFSMPEGGYTW